MLSDRAPENSMGLSDLDGFLTGIIVSPDSDHAVVMVAHYLGGDEPECSDIEEAQTIIGTIMARYNQIIGELDVGLECFDPMFWKGRDGQATITTDWAGGFLDAVRLRAKAWEPLLRHKDARVMMIPLLVLGADDDNHPPFGQRPLAAQEVEHLLKHGAQVIPECSIGVRPCWLEPCSTILKGNARTLETDARRKR
jgi:uncharacterized protein